VRRATSSSLGGDLDERHLGGLHMAEDQPLAFGSLGTGRGANTALAHFVWLRGHDAA
jgi:hypothetical protein